MLELISDRAVRGGLRLRIRVFCRRLRLEIGASVCSFWGVFGMHLCVLALERIENRSEMLCMIFAPQGLIFRKELGIFAPVKHSFKIVLNEDILAVDGRAANVP
jgi:hypothetical protein